MARVLLNNLSKTFASDDGGLMTALRQISLEVLAGERLVVLGPSGSGKSTLLRLVAGLETPTGGTVQLGDKIVNETPPDHRDVALVFQNHALYPHLTGFENMALPLQLRGWAKNDTKIRVCEVAECLGLGKCLDRRPEHLSGGERQRIGLGRAIIRKPSVLLLDEPLTSVDAPLRAQLREEIITLQARLGMTMLYVTHDQEEAMTLGGRMAVLHNGELQQLGSAMEIYQRPANRFVAGFVGTPSMNLLPGKLVRKGYTLFFRPTSPIAAEHVELTLFKVADDLTAGLKDHVDQPLVLGLRPEALRPAGDSDKESGPILAKIDRVERLGAVSRLRLEIPEGFLTASFTDSIQVERGQALQVAVDMTRAHFFDSAGQVIPARSSR